MVVRKEQVTQAYLTSTSMVVDIYCRVSGKKQEDNTSLDEQEEMGRKFAEENGLTVGLVHREVGSGFTLDRKKLKEMQDRYRRGIIQGVIIWKIGRLARKQEFINYLMVEMKVYSCQLFCVYTPLDENDEDYQLRLFLETFFADRERKEVVTKLATARTRSVVNGENYGSCGNKPLYGYDWIWEKKGKAGWKKVGFSINIDKSKHVKQVFNLFDEGKTLQDIRRTMLEVAPEASKWKLHNIKRMLSDVRYTGKNATAFFTKKEANSLFQKVDLPDGTYPQIIADDLFERVQKRLQHYRSDSPKRNQHPENYLLRGGFIYCGVCGHTMVCNLITRQSGKQEGKYVCRHDLDTHYMGTTAKKVDREVWSHLEEIAKESPRIKQAIEKMLATDLRAQNLSEIDEKIEEHKAKIAKLEEDLDMERVPDDMRAFVYERISAERRSIESLQMVKKDTKEMDKRLERKRETYRKIYQWYEKLNKSIDTAEPLDYDEKRDFLRMIGAKITIHPFVPENGLKQKRWTITADVFADEEDVKSPLL